MIQLPLEFDLPQITRAPVVRGASIEQRFRSFHDLNPHVYFAFVSLARQCQRRGWPRAGAKEIFERLRFEFRTKTRGEHWRLNNNYTAHYARKAMAENSDLAGFFETRERTTA